MSKSLYYPPIDSQFPEWIDNFYEKILVLAAIIGIRPAELAKLKLIRDALVFAGGRITAHEDARMGFVKTRQTILYGDPTNELLKEVNYETEPEPSTAPAVAPANARPFIQNLVDRVRACPDLSKNQKKGMGVLRMPRPLPKKQAVLKGAVVNGIPVLKCKLLGLYGFEVWRAVTGTKDFAYFDRSASNTYKDKSALPEGLGAVQYDYKVRLIGADNEPVTKYSNVVTLTKTA